MSSARNAGIDVSVKRRDFDVATITFNVSRFASHCFCCCSCSCLPCAVVRYVVVVALFEAAAVRGTQQQEQQLANYETAHKHIILAHTHTHTHTLAYVFTHSYTRIHRCMAAVRDEHVPDYSKQKLSLHIVPRGVTHTSI